MRPFPFQFPHRSLGIAALLLIASLSLVLKIQAQDTPGKELSAQVSAELGKLRALVEVKNYKEGIRLLDTLIAVAPAESYDRALLSQIKGQVLLTDSQYDAAIGAFEEGLKIGGRHDYFDQNTVLGTLYTLSQLYYRQGIEIKDPALKKILLEKAHTCIDRWLCESPKLSVENQLFAASILYTLATFDPAHTDFEKIRQSLMAAEKSLYLNLRVNNQAYLIMLAALQQLGETCKTADILELLVQREPSKLLYWQQLLATYYSLAEAAKNAGDSRRYHLRALITYERAQSHGLLDTPSDNSNIVALYFHLRQFDQMAVFLTNGLKDGSIASTRRNWELLSFACQQQHDDARAVVALQEAIRILPEDGQIEFSLAQFYHAHDQPAEAYARLEIAVAKGNLDKPGQTCVFLAYVAYELKRFDDAAKWAVVAAGKPDVKEEDLARLTRAIKAAITKRDVFKTSQL